MLQSSFCVMACDGEIHDLEIQEIYKIAKETPYFEDLDIALEIEEFEKSLKEKGRIFFSEYFHELENQDIDEIQKLLLFEVVLRIIHADQKLDENEVRFLRAMKKRLDLPEELIRDRFGEVKALGIRGSLSYESLSSKELANKFEIQEIPKLDIDEGDSKP